MLNYQRVNHPLIHRIFHEINHAAIISGIPISGNPHFFLCWNEVIPSVFQKLCIISCVSKSLCSPLHNTVEEGWDGGRVAVL